MTNTFFDIILIHAPSVYDFRDRDDICFSYLSNSDSVHVSPVFEMPPVGLLAIRDHLQQCGYKVAFFNIASHMLKYPDFCVETFFKAIPSKIIGIDLHWLAHAHGALEIASLYKSIHPEAKTLFGGISATYYHEELVAYPQADFVMRGYDTLLPLEMLMERLDSPGRLQEVPNLTYKQHGEVIVNSMDYIPEIYNATVDWSVVFNGATERVTPYNIVIPQAGCEYNCRLCGGSRYFFKNTMGLEKRAQKTAAMLHKEIKSIPVCQNRPHTVTTINFWHETPELLAAAKKALKQSKETQIGETREETGSKRLGIDTVHYSLHRLPEPSVVRDMARSGNVVLELSPDSSDLRIADACGRGKYTMEELEYFIDELIDDVFLFEIYFMIGLPFQSPDDVWKDVAYCEHLLEKYKGRRVMPYICPMLPFLDPGSEIFENPEKWGYQLHHKTLEEHRKALLSMNWKHRLNYSTRWMSRDELVDISYQSVRALTKLKEVHGKLSKGVSRSILDLIDDTVDLQAEIDNFQMIPEGDEKLQKETELKEIIATYNQNSVLKVRSQQRPVDFGFARKQWFDTDDAILKYSKQTAEDGVKKQ